MNGIGPHPFWSFADFALAFLQALSCGRLPLSMVQEPARRDRGGISMEV
jgi:hypothetical protein